MVTTHLNEDGWAGILGPNVGRSGKKTYNEKINSRIGGVMKTRYANPADLMKCVVAALVLGLILPAALVAQQKPTAPSRNPPRGMSDTDRDLYFREMNIRRLELERKRNAKPRAVASEETIKQVTEDFGRIQEINSEIMKAYISKEPPDYKRLSEATEEIRTRASRLNSNLMLPPSERDQKREAKAEKREARSPLLDLNDSITSFVTNPLFKKANTIDAELGRKAKSDLEEIIELSAKISKSAEELNKAAAKSN